MAQKARKHRAKPLQAAACGCVLPEGSHRPLQEEADGLVMLVILLLADKAVCFQELCGAQLLFLNSHY